MPPAAPSEGLSRRALFGGGLAAAAAGLVPRSATGSAEAAVLDVSTTPSALPDTVSTLVAAPFTPTLPVPDDAALHLLRRTTHGPAPQDWLTLQAHGGPAAWLADQLRDLPDLACDAETKARFPKAFLPPSVLCRLANGEQTPEAKEQVAQAHLFRQLTSTRQLFEQVVDVFFNRLNVPFTADSGVWTYGSYYDEVIRTNAYGRYADMVAAMIRNGAMLEYLNANTSYKHHPNENLGRELLELHTVGIVARYTERDVKHAALVLTGLSTNATDGSYAYQPSWHHTGPVKVLGWSSPNTDPMGEAVALAMVDYLTHHPACARRIATTLATRFVADTPSARLVSDLAAVYLANDTALVPVLRALFAHRDFSRSRGAKMRRPSQQALAFARTVGVRGDTNQDGGTSGLLSFLLSYGDACLNWPAPDGLPDVAAFWLSSSARRCAMESADRTLNGWGAGLTKPAMSDLRPGLPHETGGALWLPTTPVSAVQVLDALAVRHLGQPLPASHRAAVAKATGWNLRAPAAPLQHYDAGLSTAVLLIAGHPQHAVR